MHKTVLRVALAALGVLLVPWVASRVVEGWNWPPGAFVFTYALFFGTGMTFALIAGRLTAWSYKAAVGVALAAGFVLGWATMVHMSESDNPVNLVYFGVLLLGAVGAGLTRLEPRGMARAMFILAVALAVAGVIVRVLRLHTPAGPLWDAGIVHGGLVLLFTVSGLLFRRASLHVSK